MIFLQNDKEIVLAAVTQCGDAWHHASRELQSEKEVALAAVTQDGRAINHASEELQSNKEVVQAAIMQLLIQSCHFDTNSLIQELVSKQVLVPLDLIHVASACKLCWNHGMSKLIGQDHLMLESKDEATGLFPFMTFASSNSESQNHTLI